MENLEKSKQIRRATRGVDPFTPEQRQRSLDKSRKDGITVLPPENKHRWPDRLAVASGAFRVTHYARERMGNPQFVNVRVNPFKHEITVKAGDEVKLRRSGLAHNQPKTPDFGYHKDVRFCQPGRYEHIGNDVYRLKVDNK